MGYQYHKPWLEPGYKGKLRQTLSINRKDYPPPTVDQMTECTIQLLIDELIPEEMALKLLTRYERYRQEGYWNLPE